ncbi:MAG TPA: ATP-binding protein [Telluria sp.]|nr:ATP-binding protein [Telluria sp.]
MASTSTFFTAPTFEPAGIDTTAGHKIMQQLIHLRWIAVAGQITTIAVVSLFFGIKLPIANMSAVLACLIAFNVGCHLRWHEQREVSYFELFLALLVDVASLTALLYYSGGIANPFAFLFLLQVSIGAVMLRRRGAWAIGATTILSLVALSFRSWPLASPFEPDRTIGSLYIQGLIICFALNAALLVFFITRIMRSLRARDAELADLRQRAAEEDHIIRMGLLASGAAHELGTPLATLSVILGDWKHVPEIKRNPDLLEDLNEMQAQLKRCKSIVSAILLSAGETRGESSARTTVRTFLDKLAAEWRASRPVAAFEYQNYIDPDMPAVFDATIRQMIWNVLDNAFDASPEWLRFEARREGDKLVLAVADSGPGFDPKMLEQFGKPYQSSKGRPGGGLGLFLVVNVARTLGGSVDAQNRKEGGALVELKLPLQSIAYEDRHGGKT